MPNRYPLIANPSTSQIQELASGDNIDLSGNDIVGVVDITATGNISTSGSIVAGGVSYPTAVGGDGQVLTSDGAGGTAWEDSSVSGLPSGNAGESLLFRGDTWVISPQNFDVATNNYDSDWNSVHFMIPFDSETGQPGQPSWETPIYGSIGGYGATPGTSFVTFGISETVHTVGNVALSSTGAKFGGNSVRFTGQTTGYIEFPDTNKTNNATGNGNQDQLVAIGSGNFTMEFWFKVDHINWTQDIVSVLGTSSGNTNGCWTFRTETSGAFNFMDDQANTTHHFLDGGTGNQIAVDTWYHAAISRDNNVLRLFLNGVQKLEATNVITDYTLDEFSIGADACLRFGAGQPNQINGMEGNIDDFRITKGKARYLASFTPPTQGFANTDAVVYGDITYPLGLHTDVDLVTSVPQNGQVFTWDATGGSNNDGAWVSAGILNGLVTSTATDVTFTGDLNINYDEKITIGGGVAGNTHSMRLYSETSGFKYNYLQSVDGGLKIRSDDGSGGQGNDIDFEIGTQRYLNVHNSGVRLYGGGSPQLNLEAVGSGVDVTGDITFTGDILPDTDDLQDIGSASKKIRDLYLGPNSLHLGTVNISESSGKLVLPAVEMTGHFIPDTNAAYDLGNAEYKIRHLFLSDNSLWVGDDHKVSIEGGKMKFKKRKKSVVPASITAAGGNEAGALAHSGKASLDLISCFEWLAYLTSLDASKTDLSDLFPPESSGVYTDDDYDEIINQHGPGKHPAPAVSGVAVLPIPLFTGNTFVLDNPTDAIQLDVVGAAPTPGNNIDFKVYVIQGSTERTIASVTIDGVAVTSMRVLGTIMSDVMQVFEVKCLYHNGGWNAIITAQ